MREAAQKAAAPYALEGMMGELTSLYQRLCSK
jgi:hypothetical protein